MSFDRETRNRLAAMVAACRNRLTSDVEAQLPRFGIYRDRAPLAPEELGHLSEPEQARARALRELHEHFAAVEPGAEAERRAAAYDRMVLEIAFTTLNRLAALRLCEERGLVQECVRKGPASAGFQVFEQPAGGALGTRHETYRVFLELLFDELAVDLGILFDRTTPQSAIFPSERGLEDVLAELNKPELARLWAEDETIGWIYQYFNPREERKAMREASQAPRNSRELAVRNQFFTPRYVVEFLTDNTLGRTWYEMRAGDTRLRDACRYLVRRPDEVFLSPSTDEADEFPAEGIIRAARLLREGDDASFPPFGEDDESDQRLIELAHTVNGYDRHPLDPDPAHPEREDTHAWMARLGQEVAETETLDRWSTQELFDLLFLHSRAHRHGGAYEAFQEYFPAARRIGDEVRRRVLQARRPDATQEELLRAPVFIPYRVKKDPREIKVLDPACGSGHFLLYAFDLLQTIYAEAYDDPHLGPALQEDYPDRAAFERAVPGLILARNLHGIDIDARCCQIAALALWLRAQRAWQALGLAPADRPRITRTNIVTAEPMPGESDLLREFTARLDPPLLGEVVETVFEKMKLAGEAGSLLKIEEDIRETLAAARRQWLAHGAQMEMTGMGPRRTEQGRLFDLSGITDAEFWQTAEERILHALREYAEQVTTDRPHQRRLFAEDAAQGFAFIDLCRQRYDVVLMNPPFGDAPKAGSRTLDADLAQCGRDIGAAFVASSHSRWAPRGLTGSLLTATTWFHLSFESWRRSHLLGAPHHLITAAHLGGDVLDDATVAVIAQVTGPPLLSGDCASIYRLMKPADKEESLAGAIYCERTCHHSSDVYAVDTTDFERLPGAPLAYWISPRLRSRVALLPVLEGLGATVRQGTATADESRFTRAWWEVNGDASVWLNFTKSSEYSPYWDDVTWVLNFRSDGREIRSTGRARVQGTDKFGLSGVSFPSRSVLGFNPRAHPAGAGFSHTGSVAIPTSGVTPLFLLGYLSSRPVEYITSFFIGDLQGEPGLHPNHYEVGVVQRLPWVALDEPHMKGVERLAGAALMTCLQAFTRDETSRLFGGLSVASSLRNMADVETRKMRQEMQRLLEIRAELDRVVADPLGFTTSDVEMMDIAFAERFPPASGRWRVYFGADWDGIKADEVVDNLLSYVSGVAFGRWDLRLSVDRSLAIGVSDPFAPLPSWPPAMLVGPDGRPSARSRIVSPQWLRVRPDANTLPPEGSVARPVIPDAEYPLPVPWDGILVDDPGSEGGQPHRDDLVMRVRRVLDLLFGERAPAIEQEACEILGTAELREYFRRPAGFFQNHLRRYSKSRRKAPIYWPLSTTSGSYTAWVYYPRLTDQTLYTIVNRYVEPKIAEVESAAGRAEVAVRAASGREAARLRERYEKLRALLAELREFREELLRVAALPYRPDLNDGVIITAAPLHRLFRHGGWAKDTRETWAKLEKGDYDWAHLALAIWPERVRAVCRRDRSIAIAHGLEELCEAPAPTPKAKSRGRKRGSAAANGGAA